MRFPQPTSTTMPNDYTYWFNGMYLGSGSPYITSGWTGLLSAPPVVQYHSKAQAKHGVVYGFELFDARTLECDFAIDGSSALDLESKMEDLANAMVLPLAYASEIELPFAQSAVDTPFVVKRPGKKPRQIFCHINNFDPGKADFHQAMGMTSGSIQWYAGDPRVYSLDLNSQSVSIATSQIISTSTIVNAGSFPSPRLTLTIQGPVTGGGPVVIQNSTASGTPALKINVTLAGTDTMIVDFFNKTITINGTDTYQDKDPSSQWWDLLPGPNTIVVSRTTTNAVSAPATLTWYDAWTTA